MRREISRATVLLVFAVALTCPPAFAHEGAGGAGGFLSGLRHPVSGWDHIVAMIAVGLWGAQLGRPAIYLLPITFPLVMAFGGFLGLVGIQLQFVEIGIAASAIVLGLAVTFEVRPPLWISMAVVAAFAIFHGYAHGTELETDADALAYSMGFVIATGLLHATGIAIGLINGWRVGEWVVQALGATVAVAGVVFLAQAVS